MNSRIKSKEYKVLLFITCIFSCFKLSAQESKSVVQFNQYENEIAIDMQNIFRGTLGTSIIYKKRIGERKFVSANERKVVRFSVGGSGEISLSDELNFISDSISPLNFTDLFRNGYQFHGLVGFEWQKQVNRIQYFYGFETGFEYSKYNQLNGWSWNSNEGYTHHFNDERIMSIPLIGLGGIKFFISKFFSVSLESNFKINYQAEKLIRKLQTPRTSYEYTSEPIKRKEINFNFDYLSALSLSYYF